MTKTAKAPSKSDLNAADELDRMADLICSGLTDTEISALDDLKFGQAIASDGAARQLRIRAAELRQDPNGKFL